MENPQTDFGRYDLNVGQGELEALEDVGPSEPAMKVKPSPSPSEPTNPERELRNLTRMPYMSWCMICVEIRGKHSPHYATKDRRHAIQLDSGFMSLKERPREYATILTAIDTRTQLSREKLRSCLKIW